MISEANPKLPVKFILLAPTSIVGGIATWTKYFLNRYDQNKIRPLVIDTSKKYEEIGKESNIKGIILGILNSFRLLFKLVFLIIQIRPGLVYLTCSAYWSFFTRDLMLIAVSRRLGLKVIIHLRGGHISSFFGHSYRTCWMKKSWKISILQIIITMIRSESCIWHGKVPRKDRTILSRPAPCLSLFCRNSLVIWWGMRRRNIK